MQSKAKTVKAYLAELPADRRVTIEAVRKVILTNLDTDYEEGMSYGGIGYFIPHAVYPPGYHCNPKLPLPFGGLASQKNHMAVYLMSVYGGSAEDAWFRSAWAKTGKKLDMGKCCIRFKKLEDLALDVIGEAIRRVPAKIFIEHYERSILTHNKAAAARVAKAKAALDAKPVKKATKKAAPSKPSKRTAKR